jgi:hypothetical protein
LDGIAFNSLSLEEAA